MIKGPRKASVESAENISSIILVGFTLSMFIHLEMEKLAYKHNVQPSIFCHSYFIFYSSYFHPTPSYSTPVYYP